MHIGAAALSAALYAEPMVRIMGALVGAGVPPWAGNPADWPVRFQFGLLAYSFILSWGYVHEYFTALREREVAVTRLEAELAQAQLRALKAQLQPHLLFNIARDHGADPPRHRSGGPNGHASLGHAADDAEGQRAPGHDARTGAPPCDSTW